MQGFFQAYQHQSIFTDLHNSTCACVCVCRLGLGCEVSAHFARELGPGFPQAVELHGTSKMVELGPKSATAYFFP